MTEQSKDFYELRGKVRHMVILDPSHKARLKAWAKQYKLTQGEIMEVLIDQADLNALEPHFAAHRFKRISEDETSLKKTVVKNIKSATPEQLAAIAQIMGTTTTEEIK
jgi:hypothetical protein